MSREKHEAHRSLSPLPDRAARGPHHRRTSAAGARWWQLLLNDLRTKFLKENAKFHGEPDASSGRQAGVRFSLAPLWRVGVGEQ